MEHDHPHALDFLRKDCQNVNDFFEKKVGRMQHQHKKGPLARPVLCVCASFKYVCATNGDVGSPSFLVLPVSSWCLHNNIQLKSDRRVLLVPVGVFLASN